MRDEAKDDGFGYPGDGELSGDAGLDVDLGFLDDVESLNPGRELAAEPAYPDSGGGMSSNDVTEFRARWADIQASFIDEPSRACEQADNLVDLVLTRLTEQFTRERDDLVRRWDRGNEPTDTEELRIAMKGYRTLIDRVLTTEL